MIKFRSDGVDIAYHDEGTGEPVVLIHGFASSVAVNWAGTGWIRLLAGQGRRVIAYDNRGHGESAKLHDPVAYSGAIMAEDARRLLDHLGIEQADIMGYSMGARICAFLAVNHPERVRSAVLAGYGMDMIRGRVDPAPIIEGLEATSLNEIPTRQGRMFRAFAERTGSDLRALAACMRAPRPKVELAALAELPMPVMVAAGEKDSVAGPVDELARIMPHGQALVLPRRDHMSAVGDKTFKERVVEFLDRRP
jgi:pimeloyl-ACP methyl ester carboxylesterase